MAPESGKAFKKECPVFFSSSIDFIMFKKNICWLIAGLSAILFHSCGSLIENDGCPDFLLYELPAQLTPQKDTFLIGDTIYIEMDFSDELTDIHGVKNTFTNYDFRLEIGFVKMDSLPLNGKTADMFEPIFEVGSLNPVSLPQSGVFYYELIPVYENRIYHFKGGFVTKNRGLFEMGISAFDYRADPFEIEGNCSKKALHFGTLMNDRTDNNFEFYQQSPEPAYHKLKKEIFNQSGGYNFYVK